MIREGGRARGLRTGARVSWRFGALGPQAVWGTRRVGVLGVQARRFGVARSVCRLARAVKGAHWRGRADSPPGSRAPAPVLAARARAPPLRVPAPAPSRWPGWRERRASVLAREHPLGSMVSPWLMGWGVGRRANVNDCTFRPESGALSLPWRPGLAPLFANSKEESSQREDYKKKNSDE